VILSAGYMLGMVQRIFYGPQSTMVDGRPSHDFSAREHILLWPMAVLMLAMGVVSPFWIRAIDQGVNSLSNSSMRGALTVQMIERTSTNSADAQHMEKR
jgi:NADH-quinone oxidoreductase subunit M